MPCGKCILECSDLVCIEDVLRSHSLWLILCIYGLAVLEKIECETQQTANGRELGLNFDLWNMWDFWAWKSTELGFHLWPVFLDTANQWAINTHSIFPPVTLACMVLRLLIAIWTIHFPPTIASLFCWLGVVSLFLWCDYAIRHLNKTSIFLIEAVLLHSSPFVICTVHRY